MGRLPIPSRGLFPLALSILGLAAAYFVAGKFGLSLALVNTSTTAVWPPTGIALAALLLLGLRVWPGIAIGAFLVNMTTTADLASSVGIALGNTLEAIIGAHLVNTFANGSRAFERPQNVLKFALLAAVLGTIVSATIGTISLALAGLAATGWRDLVHLVNRRREWRHRHRTRSPDLDPLDQPRAELAADRAGRIAGGGHPDRSSPVRRGRAA